MRDLTVIGFVITVAYAAAAVLCWRAWLVEAAGSSFTGKPLRPRFWLCLALIVLCLGINKQADFQTLLIAAGRALASTEGWYGHRRAIQAIFVAALAMASIACLSALIWWLRFSLRRYLWALIGLVVLACFVLVQAAAFDHLERLVGAGLGILRYVHVAELGGIALIILGALGAIRLSTRRRCWRERTKDRQSSRASSC